MHSDDPARVGGGMMAEFLADRDTPCPGCAYNLRGLKGGICPECNQPLELSVTLSEGKVGQLIAAIVGLAVGSGGAALFLMAVVFFSIWEGSVPRGREALVIVGIPAAALVCLGAPMLALSRRRGRTWFRRQRNETRWLMIGLACVAPVLFLAVFLGSVMWG